MTDAGLPSLLGLKKLEWLHAGSNKITNDGIQQLAPLGSLKMLIVTRTEVTAEGADRLRGKMPGTTIEFVYKAPK